MRRILDDTTRLGIFDPEAPPDEKDDPELALLAGRFAHRVGYFARRVVARFDLANVWHDDLVSAGHWGLLKALRNRRADAHACELSAYVSLRIEGAVIDEARQLLRTLVGRVERDPLVLDATSPRVFEELGWGATWPSRDPEQQLEHTGRWQRVERELDGLEPAHREVLLGYAAGLSLAELARRDGVKPGCLQSRMERAGRALRARAPELRRVLREEI